MTVRTPSEAEVEAICRAFCDADQLDPDEMIDLPFGGAYPRWRDHVTYAKVALSTILGDAGKVG